MIHVCFERGRWVATYAGQRWTGTPDEECAIVMAGAWETWGAALPVLVKPRYA